MIREYSITYTQNLGVSDMIREFYTHYKSIGQEKRSLLIEFGSIGQDKGVLFCVRSGEDK